MITNDDYAVTASGGYSATGTLPVVTLVGDPVLSIDKSGPLTAFVGETITYTLTAVNNSVMTATNVTITDTLPAGATYVSGGTLNGDEVQWAGLKLAPDGGSVVVEFAVTGVSTLNERGLSRFADGIRCHRYDDRCDAGWRSPIGNHETRPGCSLAR